MRDTAGLAPEWESRGVGSHPGRPWMQCVTLDNHHLLDFNFLDCKPMKVSLKRGFSEPILKGHIPCDSKDVRFLKWPNYRAGGQICGCRGWERGDSAAGAWVPLSDMTRSCTHTSRSASESEHTLRNSIRCNHWGKTGLRAPRFLYNLCNFLWICNYFQNTKFYFFKDFEPDPYYFFSGPQDLK